jgi:hypothetical protein
MQYKPVPIFIATLQLLKALCAVGPVTVRRVDRDVNTA